MKKDLKSFAFRKDFTLIEVLVVVAIIGILASLLLPVLSSARAKSKQAVCMSQLKQLGIATYNYLDDNDGKYPYTAKETNSNIVTWDDLLSGYDGRDQLTFAEMKSNLNPKDDNDLYVCPNDTIERSNSYPKKSYSMVGYRSGHSSYVGTSNILYSDIGNPRTMSMIKYESETILLSETFWEKHRMGANYGILSGTSHYGSFLNPNSQNPIAHDNESKYNYLFIDGHVETLTPLATFLDQAPDTSNAYNTMWDAGR